MGRGQAEVLTVAWEFLVNGHLVDTCGGGPVPDPALPLRAGCRRAP